MGQAHILMFHEYYETISKLVTVISYSDFGDGTFIALIETPLLPEGYHGVQDIILEDDRVRFRKDLDV